MPNQKKEHSSSLAAVVSTGCSRIKFCISSQRGTSQSKPCPPLPSSVVPPLPLPTTSICKSSAPLSLFKISDGKLTAQAYAMRARQLELELNRFDERISIAKRCGGDTEQFRAKEASQGLEGCKTARLVADRSFLHELKVGRPWSRLAMQVSQPALAQNCFTAAEVLRSMVSMVPEDLISNLSATLPMSEIRGCRKEMIRSKQVASGLEEIDFVDSIVLSTMERIEELALEGLRIQMGSSEGIGALEPLGRTQDTGKQTVVLVMMIKMRDPKAEYGTVGDAMVGFLEVPGDAMAWRSYSVHAAHVAGIRCQREGGSFMWSASLVESKGLQRQCSWKYIRNQDITFTRASK